MRYDDDGYDVQDGWPYDSFGDWGIRGYGNWGFGEWRIGDWGTEGLSDGSRASRSPGLVTRKLRSTPTD